MIEIDRLTRHERGVLVAALAGYRHTQDRKERNGTTDRARANAKANGYVASDLLRQLSDR